MTLEEGEGEVTITANSDEEDELVQHWSTGQWYNPSLGSISVSQRKAKDEELEALHNITIPPTGVAGNCPVEGCGKWFQHLRTHIVSMHAPKEACKYCGVEIIPRYVLW